MAQRDLLRITSTFHAMKLLESTTMHVLKGEYNDKHIRQLGMNNGADEHSIMGREIGIMCVALLGGILLQRICKTMNMIAAVRGGPQTVANHILLMRNSKGIAIKVGVALWRLTNQDRVSAQNRDYSCN